MTNGFGAMPSYASRITPDDRWRVAAYIRALQLSENAKLNDVPPDQQPNLTAEPPPRGFGQGATPQVPGLPAVEPPSSAAPQQGGKKQ